MKALADAFNKEKALVTSRGLFRDCENFADGSFAALLAAPAHLLLALSAVDEHLCDHQLGAVLHLHPHRLRRLPPVPVTRRAAVRARVLPRNRRIYF